MKYEIEYSRNYKSVTGMEKPVRVDITVTDAGCIPSQFIFLKNGEIDIAHGKISRVYKEGSLQECHEWATFVGIGITSAVNEWYKEIPKVIPGVEKVELLP